MTLAAPGIARTAALAALLFALGRCTSAPATAPSAAAPTLEVPPTAAEDAAPKPPPAYDAVRAIDVILADDLKSVEPRRARLDRAGDGFWDLTRAEAGEVDVPASTRESFDAAREVVVVERHPRHLRVVHEGRGVRVALYLRESEFREVTTDTVTLLANGGVPFADDCGVTVPGGTELELGATHADFRRVELRTKQFTAKGVLSPSSVDRVFRAAPTASRRRLFDCTLAGPVLLRDGPRGKVVAAIEEARWNCQQGPARGGAQRVTVYDRDVVITGFAPASAVAPMEPTSGAWGFFHRSARGIGLSRGALRYLWPGDPLHPASGGPQIGRVVDRALVVGDLNRAPDGSGRLLVPLELWGFAELTTDASTYEAALTKYDAWLSRVKFESLTVRGGGTLDTARKVLEADRAGVSRCFDHALVKKPGTSLRFAVELEYAAHRPEPLVTALGATVDSVEACLATWLRSNEPSLLGSRSRFTVALTPSPLIDAVTPNAPPATR